MSIALDLTGERALVTGAAGGIGFAIVASLIEAGAEVVAADLDAGAVAPAAGLRAVSMDVTNERSVTEAVAGMGTISVLVNNAGIGARVGMPFTRLAAEDWRLPWDVHVVGAFNVSKAVVPGMQKLGRGAIVNIASVSGRTGFQTSPPYSASKAAVINFTQVMARDLAPFGIRVNTVCPGMVFTAFYRAQRLAAAEADPSLTAVSDQAYFEDKARRLIPLGRGQRPEEVAAAVAFLASGLASAITGQALNVDGGLVMS